MKIDATLYSGRPAEKRIDKEERCYDLLEKLGIEFCRVDHDYANHIDDCHEVEKILGCEICKNLLLTNRQQTELYLLLMPGDKPFKTKVLSKQIGTARLSFGTPEQMLSALDITPGSVSVLGLMNDREGRVHLLVDRDLQGEEYFGCHPCINSSSLRIRSADVFEKLIPAMGHELRWVDLPWELDE